MADVSRSLEQIRSLRSLDMVPLIERVCQTKLPWVVIDGSAIARWEEENPEDWDKVSEWLAVRGVAIVRI